MRSRFCFLYPCILGCLSMHVEILIDFEQYSSSARNQGHDKWMSLIACGSIHEGHEWFSDDSWGRQEIFMCLAALLWEQFLPIHEWRCQDINPSPISWDNFFLLTQTVYSVAVKCKPKLIPFGVNCSLQLAGVRKFKRGNCEANLLYVNNRLQYHRHHRQIIHSVLRPLRR